MKLKNTELFIEPLELIKKINNDPNFSYKILDATFYLPNSGLDAEKEFNKEHGYSLETEKYQITGCRDLIRCERIHRKTRIKQRVRVADAQDSTH